MSKRKAPNFSYEYKQNAVKLANSPGRTVQSVATELGVPPWKLRNWIKEHNEKLDRSSEIDEQMQRRIKELEEEVEILKKAAAYFAKTSL